MIPKVRDAIYAAVRLQRHLNIQSVDPGHEELKIVPMQKHLDELNKCLDAYQPGYPCLTLQDLENQDALDMIMRIVKTPYEAEELPIQAAA